MTPTGIEPVLPPWKGDVLTAWPRSLNSPSRARTYNNSVNSRVLYHWAIEDYFLKFIPSKLHTSFSLWKPFWSSLRPISNSQLHTLLYFHLCPIYLLVSQGSYLLLEGISHLEGGFTLRCLQRLSLPNLATLLCRWSTTDTPVVRPSRSSRTKDSSSQISYARAG